MLSLTWDLFKHYLFSRRAGAVVRVVAWLCILGVALGVMSLIIVLSIMNGFNHSMKSRLLAVEPHLILNFAGVSEVKNLETLSITQELASRKDLESRIFETQEVMLRTVDGFFGGGIARGVDAEGLRSILREMQKVSNHSVQATQTPIEIGGPEAPEDIDLGAGEVLMGVDLAKSLGVFPGEKLTVIAPEALLLPAGELPEFERVTIKGLISSNVADVDSKILFYNRKLTFANLRDAASREVGLEIRLPDPEDYPAYKKEFEGKGAKVTSWVDRNSSLFYALRMEKMTIGTFLGLSALIASFSIVTVLVLLLTQKRKDIGVMMAMGLSPKKTQRVFLGVGLILSGLGLAGGLIFGITFCWIISTFPMDILPNIYYERTIPARLDPWLLVVILIFAVLISLLSAYFPARRHTRLSPAEALRPVTGNSEE